VPDLATQFINLKERVAASGQQRAEAEASLRMARGQLTEVESEMREMGIDPDNAEQELSALEDELQLLMTQKEEQVAEELEIYSQINLKLQNVFGGTDSEPSQIPPSRRLPPKRLRDCRPFVPRIPCPP